ncbi:MAG: hypothetical protein WAL59_32005 [Roseiarcus sp.]
MIKGKGVLDREEAQQPGDPQSTAIGNPMLLTSGRRDSVRAGELLDDDRSFGIAARKFCGSQEYRRGVRARFPDSHRGVPQLQLAVAPRPSIAKPVRASSQDAE